MYREDKLIPFRFIFRSWVDQTAVVFAVAVESTAVVTAVGQIAAAIDPVGAVAIGLAVAAIGFAKALDPVAVAQIVHQGSKAD